MLRAAFSLIVVLSWAAPSSAQSLSPAPHVELPLQSIEGVPTASDSSQARAALDDANAKAAAAMDAFDQRITERAHRAVSSICDRCLPFAQALKPHPRRMEAVAPSDESVIRNPEQAPTEKTRLQLGSVRTRIKAHLTVVAENPTTGELLKAKAIASKKVEAAVDAVLVKPDVGQYPIGSGYLLDLGAAIQAHKPSAAALAAPFTTEAFKRTMVRTAILLARPEKG